MRNYLPEEIISATNRIDYEQGINISLQQKSQQQYSSSNNLYTPHIKTRYCTWSELQYCTSPISYLLQYFSRCNPHLLREFWGKHWNILQVTSNCLNSFPTIHSIRKGHQISKIYLSKQDLYPKPGVQWKRSYDNNFNTSCTHSCITIRMINPASVYKGYSDNVLPIKPEQKLLYLVFIKSPNWQTENNSHSSKRVDIFQKLLPIGLSCTV